MLVLTRKKGQSLIIGDDIEISIIDIQGDQVRIGINAPKNVSIHRKEVYDEIRNENKSALANKDTDIASFHIKGKQTNDNNT